MKLFNLRAFTPQNSEKEYKNSLKVEELCALDWC